VLVFLQAQMVIKPKMNDLTHHAEAILKREQTVGVDRAHRLFFDCATRYAHNALPSVRDIKGEAEP
jgi:hypothetical protein